MKLKHKNRERHNKRLARRQLIKETLAAGLPYPNGYGTGSQPIGTICQFHNDQVLVLRSDAYGQRYENSKVKFVGLKDGKAVVLSNRRKSTFEVELTHLEPAA